MVTEVRPEERPSKAELPMAVTVVGITVLLQPATRMLVEVSIIALQLSRLSYFVFPSNTTIEVIVLRNGEEVKVELTW